MTDTPATPDTELDADWDNEKLGSMADYATDDDIVELEDED